MRVPKQRVRFAATHESTTSPEGCIVIDLKGLDIEGVTSLVIDVADLEAARKAGDTQADAKRRARELLGG